MNEPYPDESTKPADAMVAEQSRPAAQGARLPLARPVVTNVLLVVIGLVFVLETLLGGSTSVRTLLALGAQVNQLIAQGDYWRLFAAMFLHIGLMHLFFNGWALFSLGREVEAFYGSVRFVVIYFLAGLFGNIVTYALGPNVVSAGASGAIFGLVGADIAFFYCNRRSLGRLSQQQLGNLLILVVINLVLGFTATGINNYAHLGGLVAGFALGLGMSPRYSAAWDGWTVRVINGNTGTQRSLALLIVALLLVVGLYLGNQRWQGISRLSHQPQVEISIIPAARAAGMMLAL